PQVPWLSQVQGPDLAVGLVRPAAFSIHSGPSRVTGFDGFEKRVARLPHSGCRAPQWSRVTFPVLSSSEPVPNPTHPCLFRTCRHRAHASATTARASQCLEDHYPTGPHPLEWFDEQDRLFRSSEPCALKVLIRRSR